MAFPVNVDATWVNPASVTLDGGELRRADAAMFAGNGSALGVSGGVVRHGDSSLAVSIDASDNVTIQPGPVVVPGNAVAGTGCYRFGLATATTQSITSLRDATNPKIVLVVARQMDTDVVASHAAYTGRFDVIAGTPSATPSAPALPSMAVELARITLPATGGGAATVDSTHRTYAAALGGMIYVPTFSMLPTSAAKFQLAKELDTGVEREWDGSAWQPRTWVDYSPVLRYADSISSGPGYTIDYAKWRRVGNVVEAIGSAIINSTASNPTAVKLPVAASFRQYDLGSAYIMGSSAPSTQTGVAYMISSLDYLVCITSTTAFLNAPASHWLRWNIKYHA